MHKQFYEFFLYGVTNTKYSWDDPKQSIRIAKNTQASKVYRDINSRRANESRYNEHANISRCFLPLLFTRVNSNLKIPSREIDESFHATCNYEA